MKKRIALITATVTTLLSAIPTLAATNVTNYSSFNANGSYIGTAVIDKTGVINAEGGDITITDIEETNIKDSGVETLVKTGSKAYNIKGRNIDIASVEKTSIDSSAVGTYVDQKVKSIKTRAWK